MTSIFDFPPLSLSLQTRDITPKATVDKRHPVWFLTGHIYNATLRHITLFTAIVEISDERPGRRSVSTKADMQSSASIAYEMTEQSCHILM